MEWNVYLRGHWVGRVHAQDEWAAYLGAFVRFNPCNRRGLRVVRV